MSTIKKWTSTTQYVDLETGEVLTKKIATRDYKTINITKKVKVYGNNTNHACGYITWIHECRPTKQGKLFK